MALSKGRSPLGLKDYEDDVQGNGHRPLSPAQRHRYEHQRLLTFANWPDWAPASAARLAKYGFFYTGREDEVECFACHRNVRGWKLGDNPEHKHRQVSPNCRYINGVNKENIPIYVAVSSPEENAGLQRTIYTSLGLQSLGNQLSQGAQYAEGSLGAVLTVPNGNSVGGETPYGTASAVRNSMNERAVLHNEGTRKTPRSAVNSNAQGGVDTTDNLAARSPPNETNQNLSQNSNTTTPTLTSVRESEDFMLIMRENELTRMQTYANFPDSCPVRPNELAKAGFFYLGTSDIVKCAYCGGKIRSWGRGDDAFGEHLKHFPLCSFVQQRQNREQSSSQQNNLLFDDNPIVTERPKHPQYAIEQNRILTFENWPISKRQTPRELSIAGFYYAGFGDNVKCFFCGGGLRNWEPQDDVWTEHARWFPNCGYVKQCKGVSFIREILQRNSANGQFSSQTVPQSCEEVLRHFGGGAFSAGVYTIDPDGPGGQPPFQVTCTTSKDLPGHGITLVSHQSASSQPKWFHHSSTFIVPVDFTYKPTMAQLESLIKVSRNCRQFVKVLCYHSHQFYKPHWWFSRQGLAMSNWGGAPTNSFMCACGVQGHCDDPGKPCNCLLNDKVWRSDEGYLEDKRYLPVTRVYVRDTDNNYPEEAYLTVKGLECYGEINKGHSTERCRCSLHAEENSTTPGPLLLQLPDIVYGQGQDDVWLEDGTKTSKITDVYPQFFNTKKRRQIPPVTQVTPGLSPQCASALQRCPVDCERLAKLRFENTKLTDTILINTTWMPYGQIMCKNAAVKLAPPGRRIVAFYKVAPPCGFAQSSTYAFPDTTVLCCEVFTIFGQVLKIFDAQCAGINPGSMGPLLG